jgi:hypothetical protein
MTPHRTPLPHRHRAAGGRGPRRAGLPPRNPGSRWSAAAAVPAARPDPPHWPGRDHPRSTARSRRPRCRLAARRVDDGAPGASASTTARSTITESPITQDSSAPGPYRRAAPGLQPRPGASTDALCSWGRLVRLRWADNAGRRGGRRGRRIGRGPSQATPQCRRPRVRGSGGRRGWSSPSAPPGSARPGSVRPAGVRRRRTPPGRCCAQRSARPATSKSLYRLEYEPDA